ncbi:MAG: hypothetical protein ACM3NS_10705, partial [Deltaproteobacteria bacterium]
LGRPDGVLLIALLYNGSRPWAARKAEWQLFRKLGGNGVVIPSDSTPDGLVPHFGGDEETDFVPSWQVDSTDTTDAGPPDSLAPALPTDTTFDR